MRAIRKACMGEGIGSQEQYEPRITFITVQKRHKTRFFMPDPETGKTVSALLLLLLFVISSKTHHAI
jgi:hypothetical protein